MLFLTLLLSALLNSEEARGLGRGLPVAQSLVTAPLGPRSALPGAALGCCDSALPRSSPRHALGAVVRSGRPSHVGGAVHSPSVPATCPGSHSWPDLRLRARAPPLHPSTHRRVLMHLRDSCGHGSSPSPLEAPHTHSNACNGEALAQPGPAR